jgi:hypothetical protein
MLRDNKEQVATMKRLRWLGVMLLAVFGLSVVMASAAQAEEAPYWTVGGTRLVGGKTHNIQARNFNSGALQLVVPAEGLTLACKKLKLKEGVLLGSNAGEPGRNNEVIVFEECEVKGDGEKCTLLTPIVTNSLSSELVENVESGKVGKRLLILFQPIKQPFVTMQFSGTCKIKETEVEGSVLAEVQSEAGVPVELPNTGTEATSWLLKTLTASPAEIWLIKAGVGSAIKPKELIFFGDAAKEEATALVLLANAAGVAEEGKWSPLP